MPVTITGLDPLFKKFDNVSAIRILEPPMQRSVLRLEAAMKVYPAPPPHSTYRRTGTLGRRWTTKIDRSPDGLIGRTGNNVRYAPFVQSRMFQARGHQGRWGTDADAMRDQGPVIVADFQHAIERALAS